MLLHLEPFIFSFVVAKMFALVLIDCYYQTEDLTIDVTAITDSNVLPPILYLRFYGWIKIRIFLLFEALV